MIENPYLWLKALHVISIIVWMSGMLSLPKIYLQHQRALQSGKANAEWFAAETHLLRWLTNPGIIFTWIFGITLMMTTDQAAAGWLHSKLIFVLILSGIHGLLAAWRKKLAAGKTIPESWLKALPYIVLLNIVLAVLMAVLKPF